MTSAELQKLFYQYNIETLSPEDYVSEIKRLKNILGSYPKPQRTKKQQDFFDFCENKIFAEYSTRALVNKKFKIKLIYGTMEECVKQEADFYAIQDWINNKGSKLTKYLLSRGFKKYQRELNEILAN